MIRTSKQLKDLIRNLARDNAADAQVLLRNYMMERFLERISLSEYKDNFILKGGMLVTAMVGLNARSTMDIDATIRHMPLNVEKAENIIAIIESTPVDDGVTFQMKSISEIMDEAEYSGIRVSLDCLFDGTRTPLKIDISTGDIITPREMRYSYKLMFEDRAIDIWAYSLETVIAEKLETIIARSTTNTRMRDFYDLHLLYKLYRNDIDKGHLKQALAATAEKRGTAHLLSDAESVLTAVRESTEVQKLWENYRTKFNYASDISWSTVNRSVKEICTDAGLAVNRPSALERLADNQARIEPAVKSQKQKTEPQR